MTAFGDATPQLHGREATPTPAMGWILGGIFCVLAGIEHYLYARHSGTVLREGGLVDTDSYMRVLRIYQLHDGGGWYQTVTPRLGAPEGLSLHWTRPVDILILLPALLAQLFGADVYRAIYWIGAAFSPICQILACLAVTWAARPLWPSPAHRFAAVILLANGTAFGYAVFGRADHHTLVLLLTVLLIGAALRAGTEERTRFWGAVSGVFAGFGIWISPEVLIPTVPVIVAFGLFWLLDTQVDGESRDWAGTGAAFALAMAAVVLIAIPVEHPPERWLAPEFDKISLPYLVMPLLWLGVFAIAGRVGGGLPRRAVVGILLAALGAAILFAAFPSLMYGPLGDVSARMQRDFLSDIQEMQPLWPTSLPRLRSFLSLDGQAVASLILLPIALHWWWQDSRRVAGLLLTLVFGFLLIAGLMHTRLNIEFSVAAAIVGSGFFHWTEIRMRRSARLLRTPALTLTALALTVAPMLFALPLPQSKAPPGCKIHELADWMNAAHPGQGAAPIVLADDLSYAPELAFRTDYRFVAGPYHRNTAAIFDSLDALTDTGRDKGYSVAHAVFDRRQISLITRCTDVSFTRLNNAGPDSFYARLGRDEAPDWLRPVALPASLAGHFKVYEAVGR